MKKLYSLYLLCLLFLVVPLSHSDVFHVSKQGSDRGSGGSSNPFQTISKAAEMAQPGDTILVHEGTYRERIDPPRGGTSDSMRITYQAVEGDTVIIKGSEIIKNWMPFQGEVWKVTLPNSYFGDYNPYKDLIQGDWFNDHGRPHHTGDVYLNGQSLFETNLIERVLNPQPYKDARDQEASVLTWYCESDDDNTYIYANFQGKNPNRETVEINVRPTCFYPKEPGRNFITVKGFHLCQAATQWAAPTAEQIGLLGTHWSKGWVIENNVISDSRCSGITLGKDRATGHNVWNNDKTKDGATHYNEVILRASKAGWSKETIGSHLVRNNIIFNCGQTGICGSLGAVFSRIENNHIYNIWAKRQFSGAEMAGIKIHAAIDMVIEKNRIHNTGRGLWLDWMAQGTRVTRNLFYDNTTDDLFVEVNHGPFVIDNNIFMSEINLRDWSEGGAYAHNWFNGKFSVRPVQSRSTPYHLNHTTQLMGITKIEGGDNRFLNNVFAGNEENVEYDKNSQTTQGFGLCVYDQKQYHTTTNGNIYFNGVQPYKNELHPYVLPVQNPKVELIEENGSVIFTAHLQDQLMPDNAEMVTTKNLSKTRIAQLPYENPDGTPIMINYDFFGEERKAKTLSAGPFEQYQTGAYKMTVWK